MTNSEIDYSKLKILVADDFGNFRSTVNEMLSRLGARNVAMASAGQEVIERCKNQFYDIVFCDYDLGTGKTGQHVLEELRAHSLITRQTLFVMMSADTSKDVVMAAYDCEPDDYMTKPLTAKMLETRLDRMLVQRQTLSGVYEAMERGQQGRAIDLLTDISVTQGRCALVAQKLLGDLFILENELKRAESLYAHALQVRQLDWARLGLARVKQLHGELELAGQWLDQIIDESPLYLPAYDVLADNWHKLTRPNEEQSTVQRSVDISPKSILRHKRLAGVAEENGDWRTALNALRNTVKLGRLSCHAQPEDTFNLAKVAAASVDKDHGSGDHLMKEVVEALRAAKERFSLSPEQLVHADLLESRALFLAGHKPEGRAKMQEVCHLLEDMPDVPLQAYVEQIATWQALGDKEPARNRIQELVEQYGHDEKALKILDKVSPEPLSDEGRRLIASVNREGIDLYNHEQFDQAVACFERVLDRFPNNVGVRLNVLQSLLGKLKAGYRDADTISRTREELRVISGLLTPNDAQYTRYKRLNAMAAGLMTEQK